LIVAFPSSITSKITKIVKRSDEEQALFDRLRDPFCTSLTVPTEILDVVFYSAPLVNVNDDWFWQLQGYISQDVINFYYEKISLGNDAVQQAEEICNRTVNQNTTFWKIERKVGLLVFFCNSSAKL
jgi:hypothetical protein